MKNIIILFLAIVNISMAQNNILTDSILNPGLYVTVENLVTNRPIPYPKLSVIKLNAKVGNVFNKYSMETFKFKVSKEESKKIGGILGFCDGENIYISNSPTAFSYYNNFYKARFVGNYLYFTSIGNSSVPGQISSVSISVQNIIDLNEKKLIVGLWNGKFKKIIADNHELLEKFKNEKYKKSVYEEYLLEYSMDK